jgi:hypothetical protein
VQTAVEDVSTPRAINRIRRHYVALDADAARWFLLTGCDDPAAVMVNMGLAVPGSRHSHWHLLSHAASMVAVVTSIIGGVFVALAAHTLAAGRLPAAAGASTGILLSIASGSTIAWHQARRWPPRRR